MSSPYALYKNEKRQLAEVFECSNQGENWLYYGVYIIIKVWKQATANMQVCFTALYSENYML